ncbi:hypothetical protein GJ496_008575 [Pomphorhynchus laevis]|nr:hypothetical protein GJ496_008575 [Pomphorhynchus laevis]
MSETTASHNFDCTDVVAILDAGAQYGKLIDRCIRRLNIKSVMISLDTPIEELQRNKYKALIISGGPGSVTNNNSPQCDSRLFQCGIPILGICYGMQLIVQLSNYKIKRMPSRNDGRFEIRIVHPESKLLSGFPSVANVLLTHGDGWIYDDDTPSNLKITAVVKSYEQLIVAVENEDKRIYGVQFHPETRLTDHGFRIFENFLISIAGCRPSFKLEDRVSDCVNKIKRTVKHGSKVITLLSGGIDSAVCAALIGKAIGSENLFCIHINNSFTRKEESETVCEIMPAIIYKDSVYRSDNFIYIDASSQFLNAKDVDGTLMSECKDPEVKRQIIGDTFMDVLAETISKIFSKFNETNCIIAQGTLRPDLIESASHLASASACCIKTHHNDSRKVRKLRAAGSIIEPLIDFHKDEIREIAKSLHFPDFLIKRHPFPGPGLAMRIICADPDQNALNNPSLYTASMTLNQLIYNISEHSYGSNENRKTAVNLISKYCLKLRVLPIQSVGVSGDRRSYKYAIAVHCSDFKVCSQSEFWSDMSKLSQIIIKLVPNVNRLVYSFQDPEALSIYLKCRVNEHTLNLLRECDSIVNKMLKPYIDVISQVPIILVPLGYKNSENPYSIVIRPVITDDFMTASVPLPAHDIDWSLINGILTKLQTIVQAIFYDLSTKPPGTIEWE